MPVLPAAGPVSIASVPSLLTRISGHSTEMLASGAGREVVWPLMAAVPGAMDLVSLLVDTGPVAIGPRIIAN